LSRLAVAVPTTAAVLREAQGPIEELIARAFGEVLGRERVGAEEDFFTLGGHSLLATRVLARFSHTLGVELPVRRLFEAPTVAALARVVEAARESGADLAIPALFPAPRDGDLPLSYAQERLWFLAQLEPGGASYNLPVALRLEGGLNTAALEASLALVIARHESLRTTFQPGGDGPRQVIAAAPSGPPVFSILPTLPTPPIISFEALPAPLQAAAADSLAKAEARRPFDLGRGPLARFLLLRLSSLSHLLVLNFHHIVIDGWSLGVLGRELQESYAALLAGRAPVLPDLPVQYADFAVWQRRFLSGEVLERLKAWWRARLAGAPEVLTLPADRPRPPVASLRGDQIPVGLIPELTAALGRVAASRGATLFMVLLAVFEALLGRLADAERVVVGTPVANRRRRETEGLIGFFVNTLALPVDLSGEPSLQELLSQVRETTLGAFAHEDLPFELLVEALCPERSLAHSPLFQVVLALQNAPLGDLALPGLTLTPEPLATGSEKFDCTLSLREQGGHLFGELSYARDLFERATAERLFGWLSALLAQAVSAPAAPLAELSLLSPDERQQILRAGGQRPERALEETIQTLFAARATAAPEAVALVSVVSGTEALSYGELRSRARRLAAHLRELGVGPEVPVGLLFERSLGAIVSTLAVLEAGGAYVPLDPSLPPARLAWLLAETRPPVVLGTTALLARLPPGIEDAARLALDLSGRLEERRPATPIGPLDLPRIDPSHLAYLMFTSGSTGTPKGVAIVHRGVVRLVHEAGYARLGPSEILLQLAP
ncbi:MAG TPA: condensation domain-containing protein, partial [Thermoanaerobaculia bacterium]|nr:condensation domain-containing protein [Thermoanaerobaculia bacterium]